MLAQEMEGGQNFRSRFIRVQFHIIAHSIRWEKPIDRASRQQVFGDNLVQELLGILEKCFGFLIFQNSRVTSA